MMSEISSLPLEVTAKRLSRSEVFRGLLEENLIAIAKFSREAHYSEGDFVLVEGDDADHLFIVEQGRLALEKKIQIGRHSTPRNATIGYVEPGKAAGFSTLTLPHHYSTSAVCTEPTGIIVVDGAALRDYLELHPAVGFVVMRRLTTIVADRYRRANNTLTYFLSIVSHELRAPLAAIQNYLQTMLAGIAGELNPKMERMLRRSILRLTDLSALIGDVVDLARMRPEQIQTDFEWFDPGEVGTESIEDVRLAAADKEIRIQVDPPAEFYPIVGARRRMRQLFTNLLNNSIKYAPAHTTVHFRAWYEDDNFIIEIEDEGPGVPEEDLPHIFKDFYRASNVADTPGVGLGLSIAQKIVEAHRGKILVENIVDNGEICGARFKVVIPRDLMTPEMKRQKWIAEAR